MYEHSKLNRDELRKLIAEGAITFGGHKKLKIYGTLACKGGKRMNIINRVFFLDEAEAIQQGYRPCGNCMRTAYQRWKATGERFPDLSALSAKDKTASE
jgi:methylphosphotriester-DNA--protein-cysteine methyltransferase